MRATMGRRLTDLGILVRPAGTATAALREVAADRPDLVVLDRGLPDLDGDPALRMLRAVSEVPVIITGATGDEEYAVRLLNSGADDYLGKPFTAEHLAARITAVLRRCASSAEPEPSVVEVGELRIDEARREAVLGERQLTLTRKEFDLVVYLARHAGRVISRRELVRSVWRQPHDIDDQTIDVHLSWLRRKFGETAAQPRYLHTVRGVGLKLLAPT